MRKYILGVASFLLFMNGFAQFTGKPIYNIECRRADTVFGNITVELFPNIAPLHVANFDSIVVNGGYDSTAFHRVIADFMIQGGDPNSVSGNPSTWGQGNPNQANVNAEFSELSHLRGILSAARSTNINSASSQFFICHGDPTHLDGDYSAYGEAVAGMDVVDIIATTPTDGNDRPLETIRMFITKVGSNDSVPNSPMLISPIQNQIDVESSTIFNWSSVSTAKLYLFELAKDSLFTDVVFLKETKDTFATFNYLTDSYTNHFWRVRTNNGGKYSEDFEVRGFTNKLGTPLQISPADWENTSIYAVLDWTDIDQSTGYHIQVSTVNSFAAPQFVVLDTIVQNSNFYFQNGLDLNRRYYWHIAAVDNNDTSTYAPIISFFTDNEQLSADEKSNYEINLYPNPVEDFITINTNNDAQVEVISIDGKIALNQKVKEGENVINLEKLTKGVYNVNINFGGKVLSKQIIKQ